MWKSSRIRCGCALALEAIADRCLSCVVGMTSFSYASKCGSWLPPTCFHALLQIAS